MLYWLTVIGDHWRQLKWCSIISFRVILREGIHLRSHSVEVILSGLFLTLAFNELPYAWGFSLIGTFLLFLWSHQRQISLGEWNDTFSEVYSMVLFLSKEKLYLMEFKNIWPWAFPNFMERNQRPHGGKLIFPTSFVISVQQHSMLPRSMHVQLISKASALS